MLRSSGPRQTPERSGLPSEVRGAGRGVCRKATADGSANNSRKVAASRFTIGRTSDVATSIYSRRAGGCMRVRALVLSSLIASATITFALAGPPVLTPAEGPPIRIDRPNHVAIGDVNKDGHP